MKNIFVILFLLLCFNHNYMQALNLEIKVSAEDNTLYINSVTADAGEDLDLSLNMKNSILCVGYQCDIILPEGITFQADEDGFSMAALSTARTTTRKTDYFNTSFPDNDFQHLRILCSSTGKYTFSGADGEVAIVPIHIDENIPGGEYTVRITDIVLTDPTGNTKEASEYTFTISVNGKVVEDSSKYDINNDGKIDVVDVTELVHYIVTH